MRNGDKIMVVEGSLEVSLNADVLLATDGGRLRVSATNLEIGINDWVGAKIDEEGAVTVPARLLTDFVNSLPPERIDLELSVRTQTLHIRCARYEANIKGIDAQDFPIVPTAGDTERFARLEADALRQMIAQVVFAAATDESRPILTGVQVRFEGDRLTMAAADGYRLSVRSIPLGQPVKEKVEVIIPARALVRFMPAAAMPTVNSSWIRPARYSASGIHRVSPSISLARKALCASATVK